jgi:hypothetical protein
MAKRGGYFYLCLTDGSSRVSTCYEKMERKFHTSGMGYSVCSGTVASGKVLSVPEWWRHPGLYRWKR